MEKLKWWSQLFFKQKLAFYEERQTLTTFKL